MTNARLQLVFLGQLIDGESDASGATRTRGEIVGAPIATDHQEELVLWHDLDADEARRVALRVQGLEGRTVAADRSAMDQALPASTTIASTAIPASTMPPATPKSVAWTPFPVLEAIVDEPLQPESTPSFVRAASPYWGTRHPMPAQPVARRTSRTSKPLPPPVKPHVRGAAGGAHEVRCPNCSARQTMRVLCRGCASFLEVALKAKAERDSQAREKARAGGLFAMLGL